MNKATAAVVTRFAAATNFDIRTLQHRLADRIEADSIAASAVLSMHDSPGRPDAFLLDLVAPLSDACRQEQLPLLLERGAPEWCFCWPGEHYRLLAALVAILKPKRVVEIGTGTGLSLLSMLPRLGDDARIVTVDVIPCGSFLRATDFEGARVLQVVANLAEDAVFASFAETLRLADMIFIDGPKDGVFEDLLLSRLVLNPGAVVVLDDIRLFNMLATWRRIERPKLDLTSLGHFSGTGIVHWQ